MIVKTQKCTAKPAHRYFRAKGGETWDQLSARRARGRSHWRDSCCMYECSVGAPLTTAAGRIARAFWGISLGDLHNSELLRLRP